MSYVTDKITSNQKNLHQLHDWKNGEKIFFRVIFIYFILQAVPLDWKYYAHVFQINWSNFSYRDLFYIARYTPQFSSHPTSSSSWGLSNLSDWAIILLISVVGAAIWSFFDNERKEYNNLYYLLRVVLRYRIALGVIAYGFIKFFPLQLPYPSLSLENTNYGDLSDWKIASLTYGVAPSFEAFLGAVEILAGILLLNRKTASIGAAIVIGFLGNVFLSNLGFSGGEAIYCLYLLSMASVLAFFDVLRWHKIIVLGQPALPNRYQPHFYINWKKPARTFLKTAFIFLFCVFGYYSYAIYSHSPYQYPASQGLSNASGLYNVSEFRIKGKTLPYSLTDSIRWQSVVFEKWATISIRSNAPITADTLNTEELFTKDEDRIYELTGSKGRRFYRYKLDTIRQVLYLQNKNRHYQNDQLVLQYSRPNNEQMILSGLNENKDSICVVLDKIKKIYLLDESYKIPQKRSVFE